MLELIRIHPSNADIKDATPVYIITRNGDDYTQKGIDFVKAKLNEDFNDNSEFTMFTGIGLNNPKLLKSRLQANMNSYVILSSKDNVILIPRKRNQDICDNIDEELHRNPETTNWKILMKNCKQELY